jgi:hypothetical protein
VELHDGGRIWVDSTGIGMGSVFSVELTATSSSSHSPADCLDLQSQCEKNLHVSTSRKEDLPPLRILVVDDSLPNRKMLIKLLNIHDCVECEDGLAAVSLMFVYICTYNDNGDGKLNGITIKGL